MVGSLVLIVGLLSSCSPDAPDADSSQQGGENTVTSAIAVQGSDVDALSLAYDVADRQFGAAITTSPGFARGLNGGGSVLADNGRVIAFASGDATAALTAQVVAGALHASVPDLLSVGSDGPSKDDNAYPPGISSDGRYVLIATAISDLVEGDTNENWDVFRYDRFNGSRMRVSLDSTGAELAGGVQPQAAISGNGNVVAFVTSGPSESDPSLFAPDCRRNLLVAVRDIMASTTECVVTDFSGVPVGHGWDGFSGEPALNYDGRFVSFSTTAALSSGDANGNDSDIYVVDRQTDLVQRASVGIDGSDPNGPSSAPGLSADGRYVAFRSEASNLIVGDTNGVADAFVFDRLSGVTERVSLSSAGTESSGVVGDQVDISWDGRFVAFLADATDLAEVACHVYLRDRALDATECVDIDANGAPADGFSRDPSVSADGRLVAFSSSDTGLAGPANGSVSRVYVRDRGTVPAVAWPPDPGELRAITRPVATELVSVSPSGEPGNDHSGGPAVSEDGRWVAFWSDASDLTENTSGGLRRVYLHDQETGSTVDVAQNANDKSNTDIAMSRDGAVIAFQSSATNLVDADTNGQDDVFVYWRDSQALTRASVDRLGGELHNDSRMPVLSADGTMVLFGGRNENVAPGARWCSLVLRDLGGNVNECIGLLPDGSAGRIDRWTLSGDGNTVIFRSGNDEHVASDTNGEMDLIAYDRTTATYEILTVATDGTSGGGERGLSDFAVSDDGRQVVFTSDAATLVPGDTNGATDVFLRDRDAGMTTRLNVGPDGEESPSGDSGEVAISPNGRLISFQYAVPGDASQSSCLALLNRDTETLSCLSDSPTGERFGGREPALVAGFAAFTSAQPILRGVDPGSKWQIYIRPLSAQGETDVPEIAAVPPRPPGGGPPLTGPSDGEPTQSQLDEAVAEAGDPIETGGESLTMLRNAIGEVRLPTAENDRAEIEHVLGPPDAFSVHYEPGIDGATLVRFESWIYFDLLTSYEFADGALTSYHPVTDPGLGAIPVPYLPLDFDRTTTWQWVRTMLANPDEAVPFEIPVELGFTGTAYSAPQLLVMFDETGLLHVEAFPVTGDGDV